MRFRVIIMLSAIGFPSRLFLASNSKPSSLLCSDRSLIEKKTVSLVGSLRSPSTLFLYLQNSFEISASLVGFSIVLAFQVLKHVREPIFVVSCCFRGFLLPRASFDANLPLGCSSWRYELRMLISNYLLHFATCTECW